MTHASTRLTSMICVVSCAALAALEIGPVARRVRTADRNGDGRPDVWRHYDTRGRLAKVDIDSNFDGEPDIEEYYERGALVRRESDRNFNGQADLVEEFDPATHAPTRSVIDVDADGAADLLVLFRDGRPVFSEWARSKPSDSRSRPAVHRTGAGRLVALADPFQSDTAFRPARAVSDDAECVGLSTSGGLPSPCVATRGRAPTSARLVAPDAPPHAATPLLPRSPRAPPAA